MPVWHASVARLGRNSTVRIVELNERWVGKLRRKAARMLERLGTGDIELEVGGNSVHARRRLSDAEKAFCGVVGYEALKR